MVTAISNVNSNLPVKNLKKTKTNVSDSTNNVYYLNNFIPHNNQPSFQGKFKLTLGTPLNKFSHSLTDFFNKYFNEITENPKGLSAKQIKHLKSKLLKAEQRNQKYENKMLNLGRILDYDEMKKAGKTAEEIKTYAKEDTQALEKAKEFTKKHLELQKHMFGYPANMSKDSSMTKYFRKKEAGLYLMNSCGGPYQAGNYQMDSKEYEKEILSLFYKKFGINPKEGWGYITSGGTESNKWGISNGLKKYPSGRVYYSKGAHYGVPKIVTNGPNLDETTTNLIKHTVIDNESSTSDKIDKNKLFSEIKKNWDTKKEPAILLLTNGTSKKGAIDDVEEISKLLKENKIDHYIHLDSALNGGIPLNQKTAPILPSMNELGVDSISVSFHKYFGSPDVHSVVLSKERPTGNEVAYIGQIDETTAGSRSFNPFSTLQRVKENMERSLPGEYEKNINLFEKMLKENNVKFERENLSNTFVIDKPSDEICKHYQLSDFPDGDGKEKAHIIIFPYHEKDIMSKFIEDLSNDYKK